MFLAKRSKAPPREGAAELGNVTLSGETVGAYLAGERRGLSIFAPYGYHWTPKRGDQVLVLKTGEAGESLCVAGVRQSAGDGPPPGTVVLRSDGGAGMTLGADGKIRLTGPVLLNGVALEDKIREIAQSVVGGK